MKKASFFCILLSFIACGKNSSLPGQQNEQAYYIEPAIAEKYSYEFVSRSCTTGKQSYATFKEVCNALKDDETNNNCAFEKRVQLFEISDCEGEFI